MCLLQRGETLRNRTRSAACGIYLDIDLSGKNLAFWFFCEILILLSIAKWRWNSVVSIALCLPAVTYITLGSWDGGGGGRQRNVQYRKQFKYLCVLELKGTRAQDRIGIFWQKWILPGPDRRFWLLRLASDEPFSMSQIYVLYIVRHATALLACCCGGGSGKTSLGDQYFDTLFVNIFRHRTFSRILLRIRGGI